MSWKKATLLLKFSTYTEAQSYNEDMKLTSNPTVTMATRLAVRSMTMARRHEAYVIPQVTMSSLILAVETEKGPWVNLEFLKQT